MDCNDNLDDVTWWRTREGVDTMISGDCDNWVLTSTNEV